MLRKLLLQLPTCFILIARALSNLPTTTWLLHPFKGWKLGQLCQQEPFHLQSNDNSGLTKMRTRPWITMIWPRCCQWVACYSVSPYSPQSCEHAGALTSLLSHSLFSSLYADLKAWGMDLWVGKNILLCPADLSPPLSSVLWISRKAINLDGLLSAPYPFLSDSEIWHPCGYQRGQRPWIFCVFLKPLSSRGQGQLFPFQKSRQVSKTFIHVNIWSNKMETI